MKRFILSFVALLGVVSLSAQTFHDNGVIAHRGAWKNTGHPQNTTASFRAAAEMGCHGSECDVHLTLDDSLVVYHDLSHKGMLIEKTLYADLVNVPLKDCSHLPADVALREVTSAPVAYLGRWMTELPEMHPDTISRRGIRYLDYQDVQYKKRPEWVERFKREGIHLNVWTVNDEADMDFFLDQKFNYITTDYPEMLLQKIAKRKANK